MNSNYQGRRSDGRSSGSYRDRDTYMMTRPSRISSSEQRCHPGSWLVLLLILLGLAGIAYWVYNYQFGTETHVTLTVASKDDQSQGNSGHQYLIFTKGSNGQPGETFKDTDAFWHGKWNSTDLYAQLQPGVTYYCDVFGRRNHVTSNYRDLLSCTRVRP